MSIGIISEFTAIGDFFENVVHGSRILIVVLIGLHSLLNSIKRLPNKHIYCIWRTIYICEN